MKCPYKYSTYEYLREDCQECGIIDCDLKGEKQEKSKKLDIVPVVDWYSRLIEDCQAIINEYGFTARWAIIEMKHAVGVRILQDNDNFDRSKIYGKKILEKIAKSLQCSDETIYKCIQFARTYPKVDEIPLGKNANWGDVLKLLPKDSKKEKDPCSHEETELWEKCKKCNKFLGRKEI